MIYDSYVIAQEKEIDKQVAKVLKLNESYMQKSLMQIQQHLRSKAQLTREIHLELLKKLKRSPKISLEDLSKELSLKFQLQKEGVGLELFFIDKNYIVSYSTQSKNRNLDLNKIPNAKKSLDSLKLVDEMIFSEDIAVDFLDYELRNYSYSKLADGNFLGVGYIYTEAIEQRKNFDEMREMLHLKLDMVCVMKDSQDNQYYESLIAHKSVHKTNEEYQKQIEKFPLKQASQDPIIVTARSWKEQRVKKDETMYVYVPLIQENNPLVRIPGDIVLYIELDISQEQEFLKSIVFKLVLFIFIHFFLLFLIFYFTTRYQQVNKRLNTQIQDNNELIEYNKSFISNMVHQIRTPLAVIMSQVSMLEMVAKQDIKRYVLQINAAINTLSNSYENLSYCLSCRSLHYAPKKLSLKDFVRQRVTFFEHIADAQQKQILLNLQTDIFIEINDIELERLIDNCITNALAVSRVGADIVISLKETQRYVLLSFSTSIKKSIALQLCQKNDTFSMKNGSAPTLGKYLIELISQEYTIEFEITHNLESCTLQLKWRKDER